jgi:hypothetical protein
MSVTATLFRSWLAHVQGAQSPERFWAALTNTEYPGWDWVIAIDESLLD